MRIASWCFRRRCRIRNYCCSAQMRIASQESLTARLTSYYCCSAQMRIASPFSRRECQGGGNCCSAQMRIASRSTISGILHSLKLLQRTNADCIGNIAQKCDILFCRLRCESVDSFSGITKDACADYFPVLFYCQGNQRCHYRQSRTDNRPVFYGANCTGFFCKLLLRTYARMLLRIPILESVFGISDNLRID